MRAPQVIWLLLALVTLIAAAVRDGKPKKPGVHRFSETAVGVLIAVLLLWWGGFFFNGCAP